MKCTSPLLYGGFAIMTLLLAMIAVGQRLGLSPGDALYLGGLILLGIGWWVYRWLLRSAPRDDKA